MRQVFGKSESDPGTWFPFGDLEVAVRRIPVAEGKKLAKRYGKEAFAVGADGIKRAYTERTQEQIQDYLFDQASMAMTGVRGEGAKFQLGDADAATIWSGLLGDKFEAGDIVDLSGRSLSDAAKKRFLSEVRPVAVAATLNQKRNEDGSITETWPEQRMDIGSFVVSRSAELHNDAVKAEELAGGN
jgi:hypothetical protein